MKIDNSSKLPSGINADSSAGAGKGKPVPSAPQQPSSGTSVSLGSTAAQLSSLERGMAESSPVDSGKVEQIKQAISEGRFKVNTEVVAERLLETVRDLIGSKA
ncbi:MAG: flagellar biosynthesis anti-sigma factor FlgM [Gallionella sp.]|nr:flagellar biosynthesis anti-sigma factor FlgM [Gallionella sp.]